MARSRRAAVPAPSPAAAPVSPPALTLVEGRGVRWDKIRNARARIAAGYYDRADVKSRLADAVLGKMRRP